MPTFNIDAPNGKSYTIEGENAQGALAALKKHLGSDAAPASAQPSLTDAVTDIPNEIANAASENWQAIKKGVTDRGSKGVIEGLADTGKAALAIPGLIASPITGAARSLIGHPMAQAEHAVGTLINPAVAAQDNPQKMYETAKGDVDLAMEAAAARRGGSALSAEMAPAPKPKAPTIPELDESASKAYESPEVKNLAVKPTVIKNFGQAAEQALTNESFDPEIAPKTYNLLRKLQTVPDESVITGGNINTLRKLFGKAAQSADKTEAAAASKVIGYLDDSLTKVPGSEVLSGDLPAAASKLEQARGDYAAARQAETVDNKRISAELRASSTNSGQNVANAIRQNMRSIADPTRPKEGRGLLPDEVAAAQQIAEGTTGQNALRTTANYLGKLQGTAIGGVVGSIFGPAGAAVGAALPSTASFIMKSIANRMTVRQAEKFSEMIRSRAPLASSAQKFEEAAASVQAKRDPRAIAGAVIAARNLSTNLRSAGLNFSPADLLSGLQSPSTGDAQQQNDVPRPPGQ